MIEAGRYFSLFCFAFSLLGFVDSSLGQSFRPAEPAAPMAKPKPKPDARLHVQLKDGSLLVGKLAESNELKIKSVVGEVTIPTAKISSIHFQESGRARIGFGNGDFLSGQFQMDKLTLTTDWGDVAIDCYKIVALFSHDRFAKQGATLIRTYVRTPDGLKAQWQFVPNHGYTNPGLVPQATATFDGEWTPEPAGLVPTPVPATPVPASPVPARPVEVAPRF